VSLLALACLSANPAPTSTGTASDLPRLAAGLDPVIRSYAPEITAVLAGLKQGVDHYVKGSYQAALDSIPDDSNASSSLLGDYVLLYRAKANLMLERGEAAYENYRRLETQYPDSPLLTEALLGECQALLKLKETKGVLEVLRNPALGENADTLYYRARALHESGEKSKALELYLQVYAKYVNSQSAQLAERYIQTISTAALTGTRNYGIRMDRAENLLRAGKDQEARTLLIDLGRFPSRDKTVAEKRNLLYAEAEYRLGRASRALPVATKISSSNPNAHAQAIYLTGVCNRSLKQEAAFLKARDQALQLYPLSSHTEDLLYSVATYFDVDNDDQRAQEAYRTLYEKFPKGKYAERALWKAALYSYIEGRYVEAFGDFARYLSFFSGTGSAGAPVYWMGRCLQKMSHNSGSAELYERARELANHSFYGLLAQQALDTLEEAGPDAAKVPLPPDFDRVRLKLNALSFPPSEMAAPSNQAAQAIERSRRLATAGLPDLALSELRAATSRFPGDKGISYVMSRIYEIQQDFVGVISTLRRTFSDYNNRPLDALPREVWALLFPMRHQQIVSTYAARNGLDPNLVLGVIRQESAFMTSARSPSNARGLMQILPSTGRMLARQMGISRYSTDRLYQAETNISMGTRYLAQMLTRFGGKPELALAAYNAGDSRVDRWLTEFGNVDTAEFVERIPFNETRNYVKQVLSNQAHYQMLTSSISALELR
jgi:soluble lytic murein transglycosylase